MRRASLLLGRRKQKSRAAAGGWVEAGAEAGAGIRSRGWDVKLSLIWKLFAEDKCKCQGCAQCWELFHFAYRVWFAVVILRCANVKLIDAKPRARTEHTHPHVSAGGALCGQDDVSARLPPRTLLLRCALRCVCGTPMLHVQINFNELSLVANELQNSKTHRDVFSAQRASCLVHVAYRNRNSARNCIRL